MVDVQLCEIRKNYQQKRVVSDLNIHVKGGEYVVLLGASGCGKTSVLKIIAGLDAPDHGDVLLGGQRVNGQPPRKRAIAMVFQNDALYPHMTVRQSLAFGMGRKLRAAQLQDRIDEAVAITGAESLLDRKPENLSGGESRRAAIAKAIVRRASVRLLDEPLSGLDANVRGGIQDALMDWHRKNPGTTIHVTHDGQEAMRVADRIAVMDQGRIVQFATPDEIYISPITKTVAVAIGSPQMNFVPAKIEAKQIRFTNECFKLTAHRDISENNILLSDSGEIEIGFRDHDVQVINDTESLPGPGLSIVGTVSRRQSVDGRCRMQVGPPTDSADSPRITVTLEKTTGQSEGDSIRLFCPQERLHFFNVKGERLTLADRPK